MKLTKELTMSIIIICMNNLKDLIPCINSIKKNTNNTTYEIIVVAYLFSQENIKILQGLFPDLIVIESNEIRGFSENNNLALRLAKGKYSFILNDDTYFQNDVIGILYSSFLTNPNAGFFSPLILNYDNSIQDSGRPPYRLFEYIALLLRIDFIWKDTRKPAKGIFKTYNISGAAFMVKNETMKKLGYFDEAFFFCPEDIALSTKGSKLGFYTYVNTDAILYHRHSNSKSPAYVAIYPTIAMGNVIYFGTSFHKKLFVQFMTFNASLIKFILIKFFNNNNNNQNKTKNILASAHKNVMKTIFTKLTPKEIFIKFFNSKFNS